MTCCIVRVSWHAVDEKRATTAGSNQGRPTVVPSVIEELDDELELEELLELTDDGDSGG
jgi:hypothetical protein